MSHSSNDQAFASDSTSSSLVRKVQQRQPEAWRQLVKLYGPLVVHWCLQRGLHEADAADVSQDVFRAVAQNIGRFRRDRPGDTFHGWLRRITENAIRSLWRREGRQPRGQGGSSYQQQLGEIPDDEPAPVSAEELHVETRLVRLRALELVRLEFDDRAWKAFWRTAVDGQNATTVAAELGMTAVAVRKAKSRVLHRLRESLADPDDLV